MELPHLTLYLRRLAAPLPWRSGLRAVLATPRVKSWGALLGWIGASAGYLALWHYFGGPAGRGWDDNIDLAVVLGINLALYFPLTSAMGVLAGEPGLALRKSGSRREAPLWYASLTSSPGAVLGALLVALLTVLPTALGSLLLLFTREYLRHLGDGSTPGVYGWLFIEQHNRWATFLWTNLSSLARLPQLALAAAVLSLTLRRSMLAPFVPAALTLTAILTAMAGELWAGNVDWQAGSGLTLCLIGLCAGLLLGAIHWLLLRRRAADEPSIGAAVTLWLIPSGLSLVGIALGGIIVSFLPGQLLCGLHLACASYLPDLHPLQLNVFALTKYGSWLSAIDAAGRSPGQLHLALGWQFVGWQLPLLPGALLAGLGYLCSLAFWFWTAVQCLDAARGRVKRGAK